MITWYTDPAANAFHQKMVESLKPLMVEIAPHHELTHLGVHRSPDSEKFELRLHFAPIGTVRVKPDSSAEDIRLESRGKSDV